MTVQYLITENSVSFYKEGQTYLLNRSAGFLFEEIQSRLQTDSARSLLEALFLKQSSLENASNGRLIYLDGIYSLDNQSIPLDFGNRLFRMLSQDLPIEPLIRFWHKLQLHSSPGVQFQLLQLAGTEDLPLTWEGDIVAYKRAAWNHQVQGSYSWSGQFVPGETEQAEEGLLVGGFGWVAGHCPDTGRLFDVAVQPQHVLEMKNGVSGAMTVSQYLNLSMLEETWRPDSALCFLQTKTDTIGNQTVIRQPYSIEALRDYYAAQHTKPAAVQIRQGVEVQLSGSC